MNTLSHDYLHDIDYQAELIKLTIAESLNERLAALGISRSEFARRMNVSRARVSQILAGYNNVTVETLASAAAALDCTVYFELLESAAPATLHPIDVSNWTSAGDGSPGDSPTPPELAAAA